MLTSQEHGNFTTKADRAHVNSGYNKAISSLASSLETFLSHRSLDSR